METKKLKIVKIASYDDGLILTNAEVDELLQDDALRRKYADCFPCWTGTRISYKAGATTAIITEHGKEHKVKLPLKDGWYLPDEFGIPNGKPSSYDNPKARYLWRWQDRDYKGLLGRGDDGFGYGLRRYVLAYVSLGGRRGVLGVKVRK